jgi:hypothetical protein
VERILEGNAYEVATLGEAQFYHARALWESGGDRVRARQLLKAARDSYAASGDKSDPDRADLDAWIAKHPAAR